MQPQQDDSGVNLVHRFPLEKGEVHTYVQRHDGVLKAHLRLVNVKKDGSVSYSPKGITVPLTLVHKLLQAVALLAAETECLNA